MMGEGNRRYKLPFPFILSLALAAAVFGSQNPTQSQSAPPVQQGSPVKPDSSPQIKKNENQGAGSQSKSGVTAPVTASGQIGAQGQGPTLATELVNVPVTVTDPGGRFVTGLEQGNFEVYEDKVKQTVQFFSDSDQPVSIGIIFDISGSMKSRINRAHEALMKFVDASHDEDDFFLVAFNSGAKVIKDFTTDGKGIANALTLVEPKGSTALYDAAYIGVEKVRQGRHNRKAIIIISDGQDNSSRYTYSELRKIIKEADVQVYALGITDFGGGGSLDFEGQSILEEITRTTGGRAFFPNTALDLEDSITRIALELRHQYSLGYVPLNSNHDGRYRKIRVVINPPKGLPRLYVVAKEGYFGQKPVETLAK
jgi:Ca-activated chloride channel family protein